MAYIVNYCGRTIAILVEEGEGLLELGDLLLGKLVSHCASVILPRVK